MVFRIYALLILLAAMTVQKCKPLELDTNEKTTGNPVENHLDTTTYTCAGKTSCGQMTSCGEATYYLNHCPDVAIDGDGDGIPCEDQLCGH